MKKLLCLALAALMLLSLSVPALAEDNAMILPVLETLLDTPIGDMTMDQETSTVSFSYSSVTEDHVYYYLTLAAMMGTYATDAIIDENNNAVFALLAPGSSTIAVANYAPAEQLLTIEASGLFLPMQDRDAQSIIDYLAKGFVYPEGTSGYIFPEFWAISGTSPLSRNTISEVDFIFGGKKTYFETYGDVAIDVIKTYTQIMMRYGYDVTLDSFDYAQGYADHFYIHFTNDEMEVILYYDITDMTAQVFTKPGILPHILNPQQVRESLGQ